MQGHWTLNVKVFVLERKTLVKYDAGREALLHHWHFSIVVPFLQVSVVRVRKCSAFSVKVTARLIWRICPPVWSHTGNNLSAVFFFFYNWWICSKGSLNYTIQSVRERGKKYLLIHISFSSVTESLFLLTIFVSSMEYLHGKSCVAIFWFARFLWFKNEVFEPCSFHPTPM